MDHEQLIKGISTQMKAILEGSSQAIYIYLDDTHKVCNKKFALLLGFNTPEELSKVASFMDFVSAESQQRLIAAYQNATDKMNASTIKVTWKKKSGSIVDTNVIMVPIAYEGQVLALHFVY